MKLDNRNKDIANDPEVNEVLDEKIPATPPQDDPGNDIKDDIIDDTPNEEEPDAKDDTPDDTVDDISEEKEVEEEAPKKKSIAEQPDLKERYKNSSKEAMVLYSKNKKLNDTIDEAAKLPEPTEDEVRAYVKSRGAEFDDIDELTKNVMSDTLMNKKRFEKIDEARQESKNIDKWVTKVEAYVNSPEVVANLPVIAENAGAFRSYCLKQSRHGAEFDMLSAAFLYDFNKDVPKTSEGKKGSALLSRGSGRVAPAESRGYDAEEAAYMRKNNPKKYQAALKAGKINIKI